MKAARQVETRRGAAEKRRIERERNEKERERECRATEERGRQTEYLRDNAAWAGVADKMNQSAGRVAL